MKYIEIVLQCAFGKAVYCILDVYKSYCGGQLERQEESKYNGPVTD